MLVRSHATCCAVKLVMNTICKVFAWNHDAGLTSCLVPKVSFDSIKYFCKYNFRNDHVVTKITKIFYYENLELYGILSVEMHSDDHMYHTYI